MPDFARALRAAYTTHFSGQLAEHAIAVGRPVPEPEFFPGASGFVTEATWREVRTCSRGTIVQEPDAAPEVLVLANNFASQTSYNKMVESGTGGFVHTWSPLAALLEGVVAPTNVFLTNAYLGVGDGKDEGEFPSTPNARWASRASFHEVVGSRLLDHDSSR